MAASFRLHSQTIAVSVQKLCSFTLRVRYCRWRNEVSSNRSRFTFRGFL